MFAARILLCLIGLVLPLCSLSGCAGTKAEEENANVSNIPWNRPQNWETGGLMGGGLPQTGQ